MQSHHFIASVFALMALPAFVIANWLRDGRIPIAGGTRGMTEGGRRALDGRLARLMRMAGLAMLATAAGIALWGGDEDRVVVLALAMMLVVNGLVVAMVLAVFRARRGNGSGTDG